jgi:prepilin-type N-terminal cleavage/methylation domain-containing protein
MTNLALHSPFQRLAHYLRLWRLTRMMETPWAAAAPETGGRFRRLVMMAGMAMGLVLLCQINLPSYRAPIPYEEAGLAACVVMGPKQVRAANSKGGFTLIELSIVLVIIGLIIGGIFVGMDLVRAAQIRATGSMIEKLDSAVNTFHIKYNCLPGDCANATQFGFAANGNGDGQIFSSFTYLNDGQENFQFFQMLITAGLLADTRVCTLNGIVCTYASINNWGLGLPTGQNANGAGISNIFIINTNSINSTSTTGYHLPKIHMYQFIMYNGITFAAISPSIASRLDTKFDDGYPLSGNILALGERDDTHNVVDDSAFGPALGCMNRTMTPYTYQTAETVGCVLTWGANF